MIYLGSSCTERNQIETGCLLQASPADPGDAQNSRNEQTASGEILEFFYLVSQLLVWYGSVKCDLSGHDQIMTAAQRR